MSDTGLYGSLYEQLRAYADQLDRSLIALRGQGDGPTQKARHDLAALLRAIAAPDAVNAAARFIAVVMNQELGGLAGQGLALCAELAQSLEAGPPSTAQLHQLEQIATVLDQECSSTLARMRGQS